MRRGTWIWSLMGLAGLVLGFLLVVPDGARDNQQADDVPIGWSPDEPLPCGTPAISVRGDLFQPGAGPCDLHGRVETLDGTPLPGRIVLARTAPRRQGAGYDWRGIVRAIRNRVVYDAPERAAQTDHQGRFVLRGLPATRYVRVDVTCGPGWFATPVYLSARALRRGAFARIVVGPGRQLDLRIRDGKGQPLRGWGSLKVGRVDGRQAHPDWWTHVFETDAKGGVRVPTAPSLDLGLQFVQPGRRADNLVLLDPEGLPSVTLVGSDTASISGRLRTHDGKPLAGVSVFLYVTSPAEGESEHLCTLVVETDASGRWRVDDVPPGRVTWAGFVGSARQGALLDLRKLRVVAGGVFTHDVVLPPDITVTGTVRDGDGRALGGVPVRVMGVDLGRYLAAHGKTNARGEYRLVCASGEDLVLQAGIDGLEIDRRPERDAQRDLRMRFRLPPGGAVALPHVQKPTTVQHDLTLRPMRVLNGSVVDEEGHGVEGALLLLDATRDRNAPGAEVLQDVRSGAGGRFRLPLPMGHSSTWLRAVLRDRSSEPFRIPAEPATADQHIELLLRPASVLEGRVQDPRGRTLDRMHVRIDAFDVWQETDPFGRFVVAGVPAGSVEVSVRPPDRYSRDAKTFTVDVPSQDEVRLTWTSVGRIVGRVLDAAGAPAARVEVKVWPVGTSETWAYETATDEAGWFRLEHLDRASYLVKLDDQLLEDTVRPGPAIHRWTLPSGRTALTLQGTLLDAQARPIVDGTVSAYREGDVGGERLDYDYLSEITPGLIELRVPGDVTQLDLVVEHPVSAGGLRTSVPYHVVRGVDVRTKELIVRLPEGFVLRGRVVDEDGVGVEGAQVLLRSAEDGRRDGWRLEQLRARSDAEGRFELSGLGEGALVLDVVPPGPWMPVRGVAVPSVQQEIEVAVPRGRPVRGIVVDVDGAPVVGARVDVFEGDTYYLDDDERLASAVTDERGRYELAALGSGPFTLRVGPARGTRATWPHPIWTPENLIPSAMRRLQIPEGHRLEVELAAPNDAPLPRRLVSLDAHRGPGPDVSLRQAAAGSQRYVSPLLPRGWYRLRIASGDGFLGYERQKLFVPTDPLRIELKRAWVVSGRVHHERADDFAVRFTGTYRGREVYDYDPVGSDGRFSLALAAPVQGALHGALEDSDLYVFLGNVQAPRKDLVLTPVMGDSIRGRILLPDPADAVVKAIHPSGAEIDGEVAHDGTFQVRGLPPGPYVLEVWHVDWPDRVVLRSIPRGARDVVVK